jgi:TatD DNase family protein
MTEAPCIDFHTHKGGNESIAIENLRASERKEMSEDAYFSVGMHPLDMHHRDVDAQWAYVQQAASHPNALTVGETGLDRRAEASLQTQALWFERHCQLAEQLQKPLVIHCVRAFAELMQIRKQRKPALPWIIHGFNANPEIARQLLKYDFYFSLGSALLRSESNASQVLKALPADRFFLETDDKDIPIQAVYQAAGELLDEPVQRLREEVFARFQILFSSQLS